jgi:uncharacterized protein YegP (UPF0339 family)
LGDEIFNEESVMPAAKVPTFYVYKDDSGELRWRLRSTNGKVIADSGEGYKTNRSLNRAIEIIKTGSVWAKVVRA